MVLITHHRECRRMFVILACICGTDVHLAGVPAWGQQAKKIDLLKIGPSSSISMEVKGSKEKEETAFDTLRSFIESETGFKNEIVRQKDWREVGDKLADRTIQL